MKDFFEAIFAFIVDFLSALSVFLGDKSTFDELAGVLGEALGNVQPAE